MLELGTFKIKSGKVRLCDPYMKGDTEVLDSVKKGTWSAYAVKEDGYICAIIALHSSADRCEESPDWQESDVSVITKGGICGIFDEGSWNADILELCDEAIDNGADTIIGGVVGVSGTGTGDYDVLIDTDDKGNIIAIKLNFIDVKEDWESLDEDGEEEEEDSLPLNKRGFRDEDRDSGYSDDDDE